MAHAVYTCAHMLRRKWLILKELGYIVICDFEGRNRPVLFATSKNAKKENKNLVAAVKSVFSDVFIIIVCCVTFLPCACI